MTLFTQTKSCTFCHEDKTLDLYYKDSRGKFGTTAKCKECHKKETTLLQRKARTENPAKAKAKDRVQYLKHRDNKILYAKEYWRDGRGQVVNIRYKQNHIAEIKARRKAAASAEKWMRDRARRKGYIIKEYVIESKHLRSILRSYNNECCYCKTSLIDVQMHWDHAIPLSRGGEHKIGNLVPSCATCNMKKNKKTIMEWKIYKIKIEREMTK